MTRINRPSAAPSAAAMKIARQGFRDGLNYDRIQRDIKKALGENVPPKKLHEKYVEYEMKLEAKRHFKRKGADMVAAFLERAKGGEDVSELQSVLSHAAYLDLLRRYADAEDGGLDELPLKEWLKLAGDFQNIRLASLKAGVKGHKGLTAPRALELIDTIIAELSPPGETTRLYEQARETLRAHVAELYDEKEYAAAMADHELMQHIMENYERHQQSAVGGH